MTRMLAITVALVAFVAVVPAMAQEVFAPSPLTVILDGLDYSGKNTQPTITLTGAKNGAFSGQVVFFSKTATAGPVARMSDLKHAAGKGVIPASAVEIRYALPTMGATGWAKLPAGVTGAFDALADGPRKTGTTHPVWVTVNVPANAAAGQYEGTLSVAGRAVPVKLSVADWKLPAPADYSVWADFIESPESVALQYGVKLWSEEHWRLIGQVFDQLAKVGNKTLYIPLMGQTHFGNEQSMVRWIKGDKPKQFTHDFSIVEKYLDVAIKHAGKPTFVVLYVYEGNVGGSHGKTPEECSIGAPFTLLDQKTGQVTTAAGPTHNNGNEEYPNYPQDTIDFWKPVIEGVRQRIKARGLGDGSILLGMSPDASPGKLTLEYLAKTFPWARWCRHGHAPVPRMGTIPMGYTTAVYGWGSVIHFKPDQVVVAFDRDVWKANMQVQLVRGRAFTERAVSSRLRGVGRLSADFWPCLKGPRGAYRLVNRYPRSNWAQLSLNNVAITWPDERGPVGTTRLEMFREGLQECEARLVIDKALKGGKLTEDLAGRAKAVLDSRFDSQFGAAFGGMGGGANVAMQEACAAYAQSDWQDRSAKLFDMAAEIAKSPGGR